MKRIAMYAALLFALPLSAEIQMGRKYHDYATGTMMSVPNQSASVPVRVVFEVPDQTADSIRVTVTRNAGLQNVFVIPLVEVHGNHIDSLNYVFPFPITDFQKIHIELMRSTPVVDFE